MRAFFRHFIHSLRYVAARPMAWIVVPVAAFGSTFLEGALRSGWVRVGHHDIGLALADAALLSLTLVWFAFVAAILPCSARAPASVGGKWAMPALPISPRVRVLAEVTAALALLFVFRSPFYVWRIMRVWRIAPWWQSLSFAVIELGVASSWDLLLGFPLLAAWLGSGRTGLYYHARVFGAHVVVFVGLVTLLLTGQVRAMFLPPWTVAPTLLPLMALLSVAVVYSIGREPSWSLAALWHFPSRPLHRAPLDPERQFRADVVQRSLAVLGGLLLPGLTCAIGGSLLVRGLHRPELFIVVFVGPFLIAVAAVFPLGLSLLGSPPEFFASRYCASWSWIPVRPEAVRRAVYAHGLVIGSSLALLAALLEHKMSGDSTDGLVTCAMMGLACAGCILSAAVGDRARTILCGTGLALSSFSFLWLGTWNLGQGSLVTRLLTIAAGVTAALPLVHLRRPRRLA